MSFADCDNATILRFLQHHDHMNGGPPTSPSAIGRKNAKYWRFVAAEIAERSSNSSPLQKLVSKTRSMARMASVGNLMSALGSRGEEETKTGSAGP